MTSAAIKFSSSTTEGIDTFSLVKSSALIALIRRDLVNSLSLTELAQALLSREKGTATAGVRTGRAPIRKITSGGRSLIVRQFRRGGLMAKLNSDLFFRLPPWSSFRMFGELRVLSALSLQGLNVPRPAAAVVQPMIKLGRLVVYRGLILTEEIAEAENLLSAAVERDGVPAVETEILSIEEICCRAGKEARRCLDAGVFHPDLHPGNVLFNRAGRVFLIDFDKARLSYDRPLGPGWHRRTVARWNRSIEKHNLPARLRTAFCDGLYTKD